jgi:hypothetical protein
MVQTRTEESNKDSAPIEKIVLESDLVSKPIEKLPVNESEDSNDKLSSENLSSSGNP